MNYYQFHIADFALHASHLSLEEEGIYRRLLDYYYDTESPIPEETGSVIRRLRLGSYAEVVACILEEFFVLRDDGWHNLRADSEILEYNAKAERARENGKSGGRPKKSKDLKDGKPRKTQPVILDNPEETGSKANQEPLTKNQEPEENISPSLRSGEGGTEVTPLCPYSKILDLYHQILPMCPKVAKLNDTRKSHVRARWKNDLKTLDNWRNYFEHVAESRFLTGRVDGKDDRPPFVADFDWLIKSANVLKVAEGKYHRS